MRMAAIRKVLLLALVAGLISSIPAKAQFSMDLDVMSRYVWRGADFGDSPSIQPGLSYSIGGLEFGTWAAIATTGAPAGYEVDFFASYTIPTDAGDLSLILTDYTFPVPGFGNIFDSDEHFIEAGVEFAGIAGSPLSVFAGMFLTNDDDNSVYVELAYDSEPVGFFLGFTPAESAAYGTTGFGIINTGITASKTLQISSTLSIDLTSSVILNPDSEDLFFLFGFSL